MAKREGHGWWPYLLPYFGFGLVGPIGERFPDAADPFFLVLKVAVPLGLVGYFAARGSYPELRGFRPGAGGLGLDALVGIAGAAMWVAPYLWFDSLRPDGDAGCPPHPCQTTGCQGHSCSA